MTRGNKAHQLEDTLFHLSTAIQSHISLALRDGEIDASERHLYDLLHDVKAAVSHHVNTDHLVAMIQKGVEPGRYMNQAAHRVGLHIAPIDDAPTCNITAFPHSDAQ